MNTSGPILISTYLIAIVALTMLKRVAFTGKTVALFRSLLPSWRFFEDFDEAPVLYYRVSADSVNFSDWKPCIARPKRNWVNLIYNPETNLALASGSLLQHLIDDIENVDETKPIEVENCVSYQLVKNLVHAHCNKTDRFQFKISGTTDDILISPIYRVHE